MQSDMNTNAPKLQMNYVALLDIPAGFTISATNLPRDCQQKRTVVIGHGGNAYALRDTTKNIGLHGNDRVYFLY